MGGAISYLAVDFDFAMHWCSAKSSPSCAQMIDPTGSSYLEHCGLKELLVVPDATRSKHFGSRRYAHRRCRVERSLTRAVVGFEEDEGILEWSWKGLRRDRMIFKYGDFAEIARGWCAAGDNGGDIRMPEFVFGFWVRGDKLGEEWLWKGGIIGGKAD